PDVGGGFGTKLFPYREYALISVAAKKLRKTIKWTADRADHFMGDAQGRDNVTTARMALAEDGKFLAMDVDLMGDMGAYLSTFGPYIPHGGAGMLPVLYDIKAFHCRVRTVFTNTVPVDAYRGAGRPEAAYVVERLVDAGARKLGLAADAIRRKNFIAPRAMPYKTATGKVYDSGDFTAHMKRAMEIANWKEFPKRAKAAKKQGLVRGIGLGTYLEISDGAVRVAGTDRSVSFAELAKRPGVDPSKLSASATFASADGTFPNGTHIAEVEIDPATGIIRIANYVIVDDFGVTLNPLLLAGQVHGGAMQGIGQALMEQAVYDPKDGQLVTGTFMDYALPRAADGPSFVFETHNVPCKTNPLGVKGAGEAGAIGSCPAVVNAIIEGLWREYKIDHIDMPATAERVWIAIREHQRRHSL